MALAPLEDVGRALADCPVEGPGLVYLARQNTTLPGEDSLWKQPQADLTRWCKLFPYQLLVVETVTESDGEVFYRRKNFIRCFLLGQRGPLAGLNARMGRVSSKP